MAGCNCKNCAGRMALVGTLASRVGWVAYRVTVGEWSGPDDGPDPDGPGAYSMATFRTRPEVTPDRATFDDDMDMARAVAYGGPRILDAMGS